MNPGASNKPNSPKGDSKAYPSSAHVFRGHLGEVQVAVKNTDSGRAAFPNLTKALLRMPVKASRIEERAADVALRREIGLALNAQELEKTDYTLMDLGAFVQKNSSFIDVVFQNRDVASHLAPALLSPMMFHSFRNNQDSTTVREVAQHLRAVLSENSREAWQMLMSRSLIWSYEGPLLSPSPLAYQRVLGFTEPMIRILAHTPEEFCADRQKITETAQRIVAEGYPMPPSFWNACSEEIRDDISQITPIDSVLQSFGDELRAVKRRFKLMSVSLGDPDKTGSRDTETDILNELQDLQQHMRLFADFLEHKEFNLMLDDVHAKLSPKTAEQESCYLKDPIGFYESRLREYIQQKLGRTFVATMRSLSTLLVNPEVTVPLPGDFVQAVCRVIDSSGIFLDDEFSSGTSKQPLIEGLLLSAFDKYLQNGDLDSALNIRLLFPEAVCDCSDTCRYPIDDFIVANQHRVGGSFLEVSKSLAAQIPLGLESKKGQVRKSIESKLRIYHSGLGILIRPEEERPVDDQFTAGLAHVVHALAEADIRSSERLRYLHRLEQKHTETLPPSYAGAREIGRLLNALHKYELVRSDCMSMIYEHSHNDITSYVADFISCSNMQLEIILQMKSQGTLSLHDVRSEFEDGFAAAIIYHSTPKKIRAQLPVPLAINLEPQTLSGYGVLVAQSGLSGDLKSMMNQTSDINRLRLELWAKGLIGDSSSAARRLFLSKFFDVVRQGRVAIPVALRSLVFDALQEYAKNFLTHSATLSDIEYRESLTVLIGGLLLTSVDMRKEIRLELARVLQRIFDAYRSQMFLPDSVSHRDVATEFQFLVVNSFLNEEQRAMTEFMYSPAIRGLLDYLDLWSVDMDEQRKSVSGL